MNTRAWLWAMFGVIPGLREIVLLALVTLVLYGRTGLQAARRGRGLPPWLSPVIRRTAPAAARGRAPTETDRAAAARSARQADRVFWFLAIVAATAVAAWIVTRTLIVAAPKPTS
jgi:hypothetical protein